MSRLRVAVWLVALLAAACGARRESETASTTRRNVVLVSIDSLRPDRLGCYGGAPTPTLDRLANEGALFTLSLTVAPSTRVAHASMLTGVYPCVHGVTDAPTTRMPSRLTSLAELLRAQGYATVAIAEGDGLDEATFGRGFASFQATAGTLAQPVGRVEDTVGRTLAWLAGHPPAPFFLFVHIDQPHAPSAPHRDEARTDADLYTADVRYADAALAPLFAALAAVPLRSRTIVIVTSDRGEAFGEHQHTGHGELYEEDVRVPFLWWAPGLIPASRRLTVVSSGVDVAPTVLAFLGIAAPSWMHGRDLSQALLHDPPRVFGENMVYSEIPAARGGSRRMAVHGVDWKSFFVWPYPPGGPMTVTRLNDDPGEDHLENVDGNGVSWIPYLKDICTRSAALVGAPATPDRAGAPSAP